MMVQMAIARNAPPGRSGEAPFGGAYICSWAAFLAEIAEADRRSFGLKPFGRRDRGARGADGKRSRPEMAPQGLEKIESAPGNGMASEASKPQDMVAGRAAHRALRLRAARMTKLEMRKVGRVDEQGRSREGYFTGRGNFPGGKPLKNQKTEQ